MIVTLVRHAQASFKSDNYDRLSERGEIQARLLGEYFAEIGRRFDAVCSGTMRRQIETARIVAGNIGYEGEILRFDEFNEHDTAAIIKSQAEALARRDPLFVEDLGKFHTDNAAFGRVLEKAMLRWVGGNHGDDIESWNAFCSRVRSGADKLVATFEKNAKVLLAASGGSIAAMLRLALGVDDETVLRLARSMKNSSASTLAFDNGRPRLLMFNSQAHLETQNDRSLFTYV